MATQTRVSYIVGQNNSRSNGTSWNNTPRQGRPDRVRHMVGGHKGAAKKRIYRSHLDFDFDKSGIGFLLKAELVFYMATADGIGASPVTKVARITNHFPDRSGDTWTEANSASPGLATSVVRHVALPRGEANEVRINVTPLVGTWLDLWQRWRRGDGVMVAGNKAAPHGFTLWNDGVNSKRFAIHSNTAPNAAYRPRLELTFDPPNQPPNHLGTITPSGLAVHGEPFTGEFSDPNLDYPARIRLQVRKANNQVVVWDHSYGYRPEWPEQGGIWTWSLWNPGEQVLRGNIPYEWRVRGFDAGGKMVDWTGWRAFTPTGPPPTVSMRAVGTHPTLQGYQFVADWASDPGVHIDSFRVQAKHSLDLWSDNIWDRTFTHLTEAEQAGGYLSFPWEGPSLAAGDFHVRVQVVDSRGVSSEWSVEAPFTLTIGSEDENQQDGDGFPPYSTGFKRQHSPVRIILYDNDGANRGPGTVKAIIEDAHNIGMSQVVNEPGEFFFTLVSTHPQAGECEPYQRHWAFEQYRRGNWRRLGAGILTDFDAGENDIIVYGMDYLGMLAKSVDTRFPQDGKLDQSHAKGGAKYIKERVSDVISDQLTQAKSEVDSPTKFMELGIIQSMQTKVTIYSSFKQRLDFIRGLIESHRAGTGVRTRLKARQDPTQDMRWEWDLRGTPGIDRDDLKMWYGSTLQNFRVIGMGEEFATKVHGVGTEPNSVKPKYYAWPPDGQSDFLTQTFGTLQNVELWNDIIDMNDLKRRVQQLKAERAKVGKRLRLAIRVHSIDPFDGYDLTDNIPIDIDRGLVETQRYGSGYWTLWGLEYRIFPDGHDELTWAVKPREDDVPPDEDLIPSDPIHKTNEWYLGDGPPPTCDELVATAMAAAESTNNPPNPCDCYFYLDMQTGVVYQREGPDYQTWTEQATLPAIPPPPGGWYPGDQTAPAKVTGLVLAALELRQSDGSAMPSLQATWTANTETDLTGYELQTKRTDTVSWANPVIRMVGVDPQPAVTIEGLLGNISHDVRVRALDMEGFQGEWSDVATEYTPGDSIPPAVMDAPTLAPGYKLLAVTWTPASDLVIDGPAVDIGFYQVRSRRQSDMLWSQPMQSKSTVLVYNNLNYDEVYDLQVRAVDTSGNVNDGVGNAADHTLESSAELGWSDFISGQPLDIGSADAGFDTVVANIVKATEISADQITAGDLTVGKPGNAGTIRIYNENGQPIGAWGDFGLVSADPNNPTRAIWRAPDGSMKFTNEYDWSGSDAIELGISGTTWTTAIDWSGINAEAITFGAAGGGNNRLFNAGFELQAFVGSDEVIAKVWTESADWATASGQVNLRTDGPDLRMTKEP